MILLLSHLRKVFIMHIPCQQEKSKKAITNKRFHNFRRRLCWLIVMKKILYFLFIYMMEQLYFMTKRNLSISLI